MIYARNAETRDHNFHNLKKTYYVVIKIHFASHYWVYRGIRIINHKYTLMLISYVNISQ